MRLLGPHLRGSPLLCQLCYQRAKKFGKTKIIGKKTPYALKIHWEFIAH